MIPSLYKRLSPWGQTRKLLAFPEGFSDQTRYISRLLWNIKHYNQLKKNWKVIFGLENRGETLFFMSRHFDQTMTILTSHFLHFGALKRITGDCFVIRINKITYSKPNIGCFINYFSIFTTLFSQHVFPIHLCRVAYKLRIKKLHISK